MTNAARMSTYPALSTQLSRAVCFVCGSLGAQYSLYTKPRESGAYFPFLELHDPPKGVRLPATDGTVDSCRVCYSFLHQQWESFEETKTPAIKRLYWLKRTDDGQFTGAEMRLQGEYAAQVMGLQYTPGPFGGGVSASGYSDYASQNSLMSPASTSSSFGYSNHIHNAASPHKLKVEPEENGVLDLSLAPQRTSTTPKHGRDDQSHGSRRRERTSSSGSRDLKDRGREAGSMTCYLCHSVQPESMGRYIYARKNVEGEAYFPFLEHLRTPPGSMKLTPQGLTRVCSACRTTLNRQWRAYELTRSPEESRVYRINDEPIGVFVRPNGTHHTDDHAGKKKAMEPTVPHDFQSACHLCGQVYHKDSMKLLNTRAPDENSKHSMFFPFVAQLQKPAGARVMDSEGRVWSCRACYSYLQRQWQAYQTESVPHKDRHFQLRPLASTKTEPGETPELEVTAGSSTVSGGPQHVSQLLNIQISTTSPDTSAGSPAPGLLAIAPNHPSPLTAGSNTSIGSVNSSVSGSSSVDHQDYPYTRTAVLGNKPMMPILHVPNPERILYNKDVASGDRYITTKREPSKQAEHFQNLNPILDTRTKIPPLSSDPLLYIGATSVPTVATFCSLCGYNCHSQIYTLRSYPSKQGSLRKDTIKPFFPFLSSREPAAGAMGLAEDGTMKACQYCYSNLVQQWCKYESSVAPNENNRWLRKYNVGSFLCYVCGTAVGRKDVRSASYRKYPGLENHMPPKGGVKLEGEDAVIICSRCDATLSAQYEEFERAYQANQEQARANCNKERQTWNTEGIEVSPALS